MGFPSTRLRRLRSTPELRNLIRETKINPEDFVMPLFLVPGSDVKKPVTSLDGQFHFSVDRICDYAKRIYDSGITAVLLFAIPEYKDDTGSSAWNEKGIIQEAIRRIKKAVPRLIVITDLCFCEYTSHGHCGILKDGKLDNDATLEIIIKQTLSHAQAGADMIAPSGMLDGCVGAMRRALDEEGFNMLPIMAYSAKFASGFYGPFRDAVQSAPSEGDRRGYQMDPGNAREALREVALDIEEGADIVMVKPALPYLDVIARVKDEFQMPTAAYNVSGEYAMIKAAAAHNLIDYERVRDEALLSIKRAGADVIISYFALEVAEQLR
ncbi:MAG: porphobilinogen synthase [SAR324 cluster bacterium]|uniref:Delta-aminolevulinic acid dehydratase n=1 Tax=SAR324 cluster bacterium TaxID=2024889 RepID=A0A7X9FT85_9DELT|nr:porphobilinogen synthase [SAR324 cluster bacterium]